MIIRKMETRDYEDYRILLQEVHSMHAENRPDIFREQPVFPDKDEFEQMISDPEMVCLAAEEEGAMTGMCLMETRMPKAAHVYHRPFGWIGDLCVRSGHRGQGVGRKLYEAMKEKAKEMGLARIELMVWAFNEDAKRFYEKLGMTVRSDTMEERL